MFSGDYGYQVTGSVREKVSRNPNSYLYLHEQFKSDPEICMTTLMAYTASDDEKYFFPKILFQVLQYVPNFQDHKEAFLHFLWREREGTSAIIQIYLHYFGREIYRDLKFVEKAVKMDRNCLFFDLPRELCSELDIVRLAVEHLDSSRMGPFLKRLPLELLVENDSLIFRALERAPGEITSDHLPLFLFQNRDFFLKWTKTKAWCDLSLLPENMWQDREVCLSLFRSQTDNHRLPKILKLIPKAFLADKEFVLECLNENAFVFEIADKSLRNDFDVVLSAAAAALLKRGNKCEGKFNVIINEMGESLVAFANRVRNELEAHDEYMVLLACWWQSRQLPLHKPSNVLDCDEETVRGLKTLVANYLGFHNISRMESLRCVWDGLVAHVVWRGNCLADLLRIIKPQAISQCVLKAIELESYVGLRSFPDALWSNRKFVLWAASNGLFHKAIAAEFLDDAEICLKYYKCKPMVREMILPFISDNLKSDQDFVCRCMSIDPMIFKYCDKASIRFNFAVLLKVVLDRAEYCGLMDNLVEIALDDGWADSLVFFAKSLRARLGDQHTFEFLQAYLADNHGLSNVLCVAVLKERIGSYLSISGDFQESHDLRVVWNNRSIFYLALGGDIDYLCNSNIATKCRVTNRDF